ncbi:transporter substrate-binding domain-containing protein [Amycolatopsis sp. 195334CR]|uniref:transporter substrate-binding domain-containing protein n=1 Tax=Amycolatopsis sp. 195334CR TaxID=2814588 RepID=UPI001A8F770B|nr:transporter substrate-binding domain-containing protein [Amycolatopsis sp. 195334CR]MBN6034073.1 transporter substrate-binding domain-containing protein [Amycolatopsis sp. 195334CR]
MFALIVAVILLVVFALVFWWQSKPSKDDLREEAGLIGKAELIIGTVEDIPGVGYQNPMTGTYSGFDIAIGYLVAADLGFRPDEVRFLVVENEDRSRMMAADERGLPQTADLVIAHYSITDERERKTGVSFSQPYLETEQSVMTLRGHEPIDDLTALSGKSVCTISTSTSRHPAEDAGATVMNKSKTSECIQPLRDRQVDAVTTDAAILAGFIGAEPQTFQHHDIGLEAPESWGINTGGNEPLKTLVDLSLYGSKHDPTDKRWEDAYDQNLRPLEAASLPQFIANNQQPNVEQVEVRQWPWERSVDVVRPAVVRRHAGFNGHSRYCPRFRLRCWCCACGT